MEPTIAHDETERLIASNKVEGTAVYGPDGKKIGTIKNFMVEKRSGQVEYAVLSASTGLLSSGERYYPIPWNELTYDTNLGGYSVRMDRDSLEGAPSYAAEEEPRYDRDYDDRIRSHYRR